jgi:hydroxymethylpyrimidine pyrophosphatase-like HAD family hydrolase
LAEICTRWLQKEYAGHVCATISPPHFVDLTNVLADKGRAATAIARAEEVLPREVVVIGDSLGDIPMFNSAGVSVAMGQARARVRRAASRVTRSNAENGFAWAIEHIRNGTWAAGIGLAQEPGSASHGSAMLDKD